MDEAGAKRLLGRLFLDDTWGRKRLNAEGRKAAIAALRALPVAATARVEGDHLLPDLWSALVTLLRRHPSKPILSMLLASYRRMDERPDARTRARLDEIKALAAPMARQRQPLEVPRLTFRALKKPARARLTGARAKQVAWAEREGFAYEELALYDVLGADGAHVYDAVIHAGDDGRVFVAGTTRSVALFAQGGCEGRSSRLCSALDEALAAATKRRR
jgi:hypothetical protein